MAIAVDLGRKANKQTNYQDLYLEEKNDFLVLNMDFFNDMPISKA